MTKPRVAYLLDPRFPGGTSSAVAQELKVVAQTAHVEVYGFASRMFVGTQIAPQLEEALGELGLQLDWNPRSICADAVIIQNPSFLKFDEILPIKIVCEKLIVVTHENFIRPSGAMSFDVAKSLRMIEDATLARTKLLAPISPYNRTTVLSWKDATELSADDWSMTAKDWFNICEFQIVSPTPNPRDRRGRLSRPGNEKFPSLSDLQLCFPPDAEMNLILGADSLAQFAAKYSHWTLVPFRGMTVDEFFEEIDFFVYFTSSTWRESFGRVIAEAIAHGKMVITDKETAKAFGSGVIAASPDDITQIVSNMTSQPEKYVQIVSEGQAALKRYSADNFQKMFSSVLDNQGSVFDDNS